MSIPTPDNHPDPNDTKRFANMTEAEMERNIRRCEAEILFDDDITAECLSEDEIFRKQLDGDLD